MELHTGKDAVAAILSEREQRHTNQRTEINLNHLRQELGITFTEDMQNKLEADYRKNPKADSMDMPYIAEDESYIRVRDTEITLAALVTVAANSDSASASVILRQGRQMLMDAVTAVEGYGKELGIAFTSAEMLKKMAQINRKIEKYLMDKSVGAVR